jgi:hypothetical protein
MKPDYFVMNLAECKKLQTELHEIFQPDHRLPALVFEQGIDDFRFIEFDRMLSPAFWGKLKTLATVFGDDLTEFQQSAWVEFNGPDGASFEEASELLEDFGWERHFLRRLIHIGLNQVNGRF